MKRGIRDVHVCEFTTGPYYLSMTAEPEVTALTPTLYQTVLRVRRDADHAPVPIMWGYCDTEEEALTLRDLFLDLLMLKRAALQLDADSSAT
jgi:hypothetical protein